MLKVVLSLAAFVVLIRGLIEIIFGWQYDDAEDLFLSLMAVFISFICIALAQSFL